MLRARITVTMAAACAVMLACGNSGTVVREVSFLSRLYPIDKIYRSMQGPQARQIVRVGDSASPELIWITGYRSEIVSAETNEVTSPEFMCHSNLRLGQLPMHRNVFKWKRTGRPRLFTLSQGQMRTRFPDGFGIPMLSTEFLTLDTQVLNLNAQDETFQVQHKTTIEFVRDQETDREFKPLFQQSAQGMVAISGDDPYFGVEMPDPDIHGPGCMEGSIAGQRVIRDKFNREFAAHWIVPPGRQVNRTLVTEWLNMPFDTTVHHIAVHVHPFSESIELRDLTTGETVFISRAVQSTDRIGLENVDTFSSVEGLPMYTDHEYELISIYDNTTDEPQDAMAVMYLYMEDKDFAKPDLAHLPKPPVKKKRQVRSS